MNEPTVGSMLVEELSGALGPRDALFLRRVFSGGLGKYEARLRAIGFTNLGAVLDAGCGFGQWTLALAATCRSVVGMDVDEKRIRVARRLAAGCPSVSFVVGSIENLAFPDESFDATFSFSAIYYTDVERSICELARVLRPGGLLYICSNGWGWYLYNIVHAPNPSSDFSPRVYGIRAMWETLLYQLWRRHPSRAGSVVTSRRYLSGLLRRHGVRVLACGEEGTIKVDSCAETPKAFFPGKYLGFECVSEWLGVKLSTK